MQFYGTVIIVSHDRYLLSKVPDRILELTPDGMIEYKGKYDYYLEKAEERRSLLSGGSAENAAGAAESPVSSSASGEKEGAEISAEDARRLRKEKEAEERRLSRQVKGLEEEIHDLEEKISNLEEELCKEEHLSDIQFLSEQGQVLEKMKKELDEKYDSWLALQA